MNKKELNKYIPLDKSWIIRMGVLDIINGYDDINKFLDKQNVLGDDLMALRRASKDWNTNKAINVGESGTLYRLLQFASWKLNLNKKFIFKGTLKLRKVQNSRSIINLPLNKLIILDGGTSQWASAAVLLGNKEKINNPPFKLKLTYEAIRHWNRQRAKHLSWKPKLDQTILDQAITFLKLLNNKKTKFVPKQAEDYCFARVFNFITKTEGEKKWPNLRNHESDRIVEMANVIKNAKLGKTITSKDHRVVQAIVMWGKVNKNSIRIKYPSAVNKSWPNFLDFINSLKN